MNLWSGLGQAMHNEATSRLVDGKIVFVNSTQYGNKDDSMFLRKLSRLRRLLDHCAEDKQLSMQEVQNTIHLLREVIPYLQKKERKHLTDEYARVKKEKKEEN